MSLDSLGSELAIVADGLDGVAALLRIVAQHPGAIDEKTAGRIAEILGCFEKPLRDLSDELRDMSLAVAEPATNRQH